MLSKVIEQADFSKALTSLASRPAFRKIGARDTAGAFSSKPLYQSIPSSNRAKSDFARETVNRHA
jgi:hypothetical protein